MGLYDEGCLRPTNNGTRDIYNCTIGHGHATDGPKDPHAGTTSRPSNLSTTIETASTTRLPDTTWPAQNTSTDQVTEIHTPNYTTTTRLPEITWSTAYNITELPKTTNWLDKWGDRITTRPDYKVPFEDPK